MNILVWNSWVKHPVGGTERTALELALQLYQRKHRVVLVGAYDNAPELRARIPLDMPYYYFDIHRRRIKPYIAAGRLLARVLEEHRTEVFSAHGAIFAAYEVCRRRGVPLMWTVQGADTHSKTLRGRLKAAAVARVLYGKCTHVVACSRATAEIVHQQFPHFDLQRLHVIHNGIIGGESLNALPLPQAGPPWHLGFVGRLAERKRPLDLVAVARKLEGKLDFKLHVFGDGPLQNSLTEAIDRHALQNRFVLHGYWDKGSAGMVSRFQILVHPDSVEPFGGALLEAQLGGRPVVAYRVGGNPEIVEHGQTGWLVPLGDTAALADGVLAVAGQSFEAFSAAARKRMLENYSSSRMTDQYLALFEQVCASR